MVVFMHTAVGGEWVDVFCGGSICNWDGDSFRIYFRKTETGDSLLPRLKGRLHD